MRNGARYGRANQNTTDIVSKVQAAAGPIAGAVTSCAAIIYSTTKPNTVIATTSVLNAAPSCSNSGSHTPGSYVTVTASIPFAPLEASFGSAWTFTRFAQSTMIFSP